MSALTQQEILRYSRHLPVIGLEGQTKLSRARVLCVGAGGLGCPALQYLAAAGIGTIGVMDGDVVEISNLQRQILFTDIDIGHQKVAVVGARLQAMNPTLTLHTYPFFFSEQHQSILTEYDVILDATDNFKARYLLNAASRAHNIPLVSASIYQFCAQISVFNHQGGPCYQCLYPSPPPTDTSPNCAIAGVLGILPGVAGTLQATETIKMILGFEKTLSGVMLCFDLLSMRFHQVIIPKQNCDMHPTQNPQPRKMTLDDTVPTVSPKELYQYIQKDNIDLVDVREPYEREICHIGGKLVPFSTFENHLNVFNKEKPIICYCKTGTRSAKAALLLLGAGFKDVWSLEGGILQYQETVDPTLMRY
jgi:molybdopterin/thiamine biosynthesis adenylyltransferase/rhodanese-related sulfurtransferase